MARKRAVTSEAEGTAGGTAGCGAVLIRLYRTFGRYYRKHWRRLVVVYVGLGLTALFHLLTPWPLKLVIDYVIRGDSLPEEAAFVYRFVDPDPESLLLALVLAFIAIRIGNGIVSYWYKVGLLGASEVIIADIREHVFRRLQRLCLAFHESSRSGDLTYRLTSDLADMKKVLVEVPQIVVYRITMIVTHGAMMLVLEWRLALVAMAVMPFLYYFQWRTGRGVATATRVRKRRESDVSSLISENVAGMALVQAYGREDLRQRRLEAENRQSLASGIAAMRLSKGFKRLSDILVALGMAGVLYYGGLLAVDEAIQPGTLVLFVSYLASLYKPIEKLADMMLEVAKGSVSAERILELLESDMVIEDRADAVPAPPFEGRIRFEEVTFGYHDKRDVLKGVSFAVKPGETVALVGHSGAGKSTLIALLMRFYEPRRGRILVDGRDIQRYTLRSLRNQITVVFQDARLFQKTVAENIGFGKEGASRDEIVRASTLAQAHDFIAAMPQGYDTIILEGGENLSGGQKQRIHIARGIIRDTPIVILDEPASGLDARAEREIHTALAELTRDKTTFIIAHNLSTIVNADKILLLEDGRLHATGTHEELLRTSASYRELCRLQFGERASQARVPSPSSGDHRAGSPSAAGRDGDGTRGRRPGGG